MDSRIKANFIDRALGVVGLQRTVTTVQNENINKFPNVVINSFGVSALWHSDGYHDNVTAYTSNATLYSIVNRISKMAAIAPFKVYKVKPGKKSLHIKYKAWTGENATWESISKAMRIKSLVYEEDNSHPLNERIENPSKDTNGVQFIINSIGFKLLTGNRFWFMAVLEAGADAGKPWEIINLPPQHMVIVPDGTPYGVREYRFALDQNAVPIAKELIIHSKYFNPVFEADGSHLWGISPVKAGCKNLTRSDAALSRGVAMLQNAGAAGMVIDKSGTDVSYDQAIQTKEAINRTINGGHNSGKIGLLNGDFDYLNFGLNARDMEVIATEKYSDQKLCNIYSFPPGVFDPDKATYANSKEFNKQIITGAVIPELSSLRDDWNEIASLYKEDIYVDYDLSVYPELQEDLEKLASALDKIWYLTGNEKRLMIGQDEDADTELMNTYLIPSGLTPIEDIREPNINDLNDELS